MRLVGRKRLFSPLVLAVRQLAGWKGWQNVIIQRVTILASLYIIFLAITTPLSNEQQLIFGLIGLTSAMVLGRVPGRLVTQILIVLSIVSSTRYLYWRLTSTLLLDNWMDFFFGTGC